MLAPALGESFSRWEETGSGFSGHGFNDQEKERYVPEHLEIAPSTSNNLPITQTVTEWARQKGNLWSERASRRMKSIRASWFGWRLKMRQVEKDVEELVRPPLSNTKKDHDGSDADSNHQDDPNEKTEQPQSRKTRSWVWEWSRNRPP